MHTWIEVLAESSREVAPVVWLKIFHQNISFTHKRTLGMADCYISIVMYKFLISAGVMNCQWYPDLIDWVNSVTLPHDTCIVSLMGIRIDGYWIQVWWYVSHQWFDWHKWFHCRRILCCKHIWIFGASCLTSLKSCSPGDTEMFCMWRRHGRLCQKLCSLELTKKKKKD